MTKTMTSTTRRHDLDALRAIAMLLGIVLHTALSFSFMPWIVQDTQQHHVYGVIFSALHGFRIPLFFLVSGFFTAMLWQKRGLKSLLWHRFRRIFLPLLLGMITIIPAVTWISIIAMQSGSERVLSPAAASNSGQAITAQAATGEPKTDLWAAIRENDIETLNQHIAQGADLTARDPKFGQTLLNLAALHDRTEIIKHLLEQGLPVNIQGADGSTALHSAAFLGNTQSIEILLQYGADVNIKNSHGQTPIDSAAVDWPTTQFLASLLKLDINKEKVQTRREEAAKLLRGAGATASNTTMGALFNFMFMIPVFHHLWFLWFLCWLVAGFAVFAVFATWLGWKGASGGWILSPIRYLWLIPLTLLPQWYMSNPVFGPDTSVGLLPLPHVLLFYAMFFGFGALYYFSNDTAGRLGKHYKFTLPLALLVVFPLGLEFTHGGFGLRNGIDPAWYRPIANLLQVTFAWLMAFGCMGLFRQWLSEENKTLRYISDSAYWLYIAHLPLVIWAQMVVRDWPLPAMVKFTLICVLVSGFLLITYQYMVRYTWLGTLLNGPRKRPSKATI